MKIPEKIKFVIANLIIAIILAFAIILIVIRSLKRYTDHDFSITVPDVIRLNEKEAASVAKHLKIQTIVVDSIFDDSIPKGMVVDQYPLPDTKIKHGRKLQLTINAYAAEMIEFPEIRNMPFRQTLQIIKTKGFKVKNILYAPSEFKNLVLYINHDDEFIEKGVKLPRHTSVDIVLGDGNGGENEVSLPNFTRLSLKEAVDMAHTNLLNIGGIIGDRSVSTANRHKAIVAFQIPPYYPDTKVPAGSSVILYVTCNKEKLMSIDSTGMDSEILKTFHVNPSTDK